MENPKAMGVVSGASTLMALLQSICAMVLAVSGIRVAIGLTALAAGTIWVPVLRFHRDAIRIPMLTLATVGALVNLALLAWIWRLRAQPAAQWRQREISPKVKRSERLQLAMSVVTLFLVVLEVWTHTVLVRRARLRHSAPQQISRLVTKGQGGSVLYRDGRGDAC